MPNYDFRCPACSQTFEEFLTIADRDREDVACPRCGEAGAKRMVSVPNIGTGGGGATIPFSAPT